MALEDKGEEEERSEIYRVLLFNPREGCVRGTAMTPHVEEGGSDLKVILEGYLSPSESAGGRHNKKECALMAGFLGLELILEGRGRFCILVVARG